MSEVPVLAGREFASLAEVFHPAIAARLRDGFPASFGTASEFWRVPLDNPHLPPRMKELVLLALHASATALNAGAIERHIRRARVAGASEGDVIDVLISIVGLANHALYGSVPVLLEEARAVGKGDPDLPEPGPAVETAKQEFSRLRGFWNQDRDVLARLMPAYFTALTNLSVEPWKSGALSPKEREFIYIAIDCSVTHTYGPGLRLHIRTALNCGASVDEILAIFQLTALMGLEGYVIGAEAMFGHPPDGVGRVLSEAMT